MVGLLQSWDDDSEVSSTMTQPSEQPGQGSRSRRPRRRAQGNSRERILDAATEVASELGYDGTTIALVSKRAGLPPTSIYWQFTDKDDLIAAVIERSWQRWLAIIDLPRSDARARAQEIGRHVASALVRSPDFLRLGLKLALQKSDNPPLGREIYLASRVQARAQFAALVRDAGPDLSEESVELIATYAIAGADGLFMAREVDGDTIDFTALFELHARMVFIACVDVVAEDERQRMT